MDTSTEKRALLRRRTAKILYFPQKKPRYYFASEVVGYQQKSRDYLRLWQRARNRHITARVTWRQKLNRELLPRSIFID